MARAQDQDLKSLLSTLDVKLKNYGILHGISTMEKREYKGEFLEITYQKHGFKLIILKQLAAKIFEETSSTLKRIYE